MRKRMGMMTLIGLALVVVMSGSPAGAQLVDEDDRPADDQITRLYRAVFGRDADAGGFEFWTAQYRESGSLPEIAAQFAGSDEFLDRYGASPTNEALVDAMYDNVLGRAGEADGVRFWLEQLESGAMTRVDVLMAFADSTENIDRTGTSQPILARDAQLLRLYRSAFGRFPDAGGFDFWKGEFTEDTPLRDIALRFSQSPEFAAIYGDSPRPEELVDRLYMNVLGRAGEAGGVAFWEDQYRIGRSIPEMLVAFADSGENLAKTGTAANPTQALATPASLLPTPVLAMNLPTGACGLTEFTGTQLTNGVSVTGSFGEEISIFDGGVGLTDFNSDGATDVIVQLSCYGGGNAVWSDAVIWIAGETPELLDFNLHQVIDLQGITGVDTAITSATVAPGIVQIDWAGASAIDSSCCPSTLVTTRVSVVDGEIVVVDTELNGPQVAAVRFMQTAAEGGDLPTDVPATQDAWDDAAEWLDGSQPIVDRSPCIQPQDDADFMSCFFATPGSPLGVTMIIEVAPLGPDRIWTVTNTEGLVHLT